MLRQLAEHFSEAASLQGGQFAIGNSEKWMTNY
jgi:hypothetical protein